MTLVGESGYLALVQEVLSSGSSRLDRTGTGTLGLFGKTVEYSLCDSSIPLFTTKRVFFRGVVEELLMFIRGSNDVQNDLSSKGITIWDKYALPDGTIGSAYGVQWRNWNNEQIDQLSNVINSIKTDPYSRRHIVTAWNPSKIDEMALPPCHIMFQFYVNEESGLDCMMYQRSADLGLGVPFNVASYSILTHIVARECNLKPNKLIHVMGDVHIYNNHIEQLKEQVQRIPRSQPKLTIKANDDGSNKHWDQYKYEDFALTDYNPYPSIKMQIN